MVHRAYNGRHASIDARNPLWWIAENRLRFQRPILQVVNVAIARLLETSNMLLRGLSWLVLCQLLGTVINVLLLPMLPGPIIGMLLLFVFLMLRGEVGESLNVASSSLLKYLPLILVPPAVGVMAYASDIAADFWAVVGALVLSLLVSLAFAGWLMQKLIERQQRREDA
jgi:holin-like protein